jgi:PIN domain nuclease of toxin-antitoxin system
MGKRYLIDTHVLLWWIFDDPKLDQNIREIIQNPSNKIIVSSASAWEIATKYRIGKPPEAKELLENYEIIHKARFFQLSITTAHALRAGSLPIQHRDPFDRMIMAQSELEKISVITYDPAFKTELLEVIPE